MRFSVTSRRPGGVGQPPARLRGTMENVSTGQMRSSNPPRQAAGWVARGFANLGLEFGLTEKRILKPSGPATSPKTALCSQCPTKNRSLVGWSEARRMRLSVRTRAQNALFRKMRFSSPAQTSSHLTEKRTLQPAPHGKAHSAPAPHQKPHSAPALPPSTWYRAALASLIAKGVVLKAPVLVDAIAVDLVLGYAYAARVEDRDARMRVPIGVRLEHPLVRVSVHKGCPRR